VGVVARESVTLAHPTGIRTRDGFGFKLSLWPHFSESGGSKVLAVGAVCREPVSLLFAQYQGDFRKKQRSGDRKFQKQLQHGHFSNIALIR
jgi:hypothetical protein